MSEQIRHPQSKWPLFGTFLTLTAFAVSAGVVPPLITTIAEDMAVNYNNFGALIIICQFFSFFVAAVIGGWICERHDVNCRVFVLVGLSIVGLAMLVGSTLESLSFFAVWAAAVGFGGGLIEAFGSIMVSQYEKPNSSKLQNLAQVFFCIGIIAASPVVAAMLYLGVSWQRIFILFGLFILAILVIFSFLTRKRPEHTEHSEPKANNFSTSLLKDPLFFLLAGVILIYVICESVIASWVAVYFEKRLFVPKHFAALRLSIYWIGLLIGRSVIIFIPRRFSLWPAMFIGILIMCAGALLACLTLSPTWVTAFVFLSGFGAGPLWPTTVAICYAARQRPKFSSYVIAVGALGVVLGAGLGAIIFEYFGSAWFFPTVVLGSVVLLVLSFLSCRKYSQTRLIEK